MYTGSDQVCSITPSSNLQDPPAGLPLNSADGNMWLTLNLLFSSNNFTADKLNYQLAMKAIHRFFTLYPAGNGAKPPADPYMHQLWSELQATNGDEPESLYSMSANYAKNGYSDTDYQNFSTMVSDVRNSNIPDSILKDFMGELNQFANHHELPGEGSYMSNPQSLSQRDLGNLQYDFPISANAANFLADFKTLAGTLPTSNLDGCSQLIDDLYNTPLDPSNPQSTLSKLSATDLQTLLTNNPQIENEIHSMYQSIVSLEKFS